MSQTFHLLAAGREKSRREIRKARSVKAGKEKAKTQMENEEGMRREAGAVFE